MTLLQPIIICYQVIIRKIRLSELIELSGKFFNQIVNEAHWEANQQWYRIFVAGEMEPNLGCKIMVGMHYNPFIIYPNWLHERAHEEQCLDVAKNQTQKIESLPTKK